MKLSKVIGQKAILEYFLKALKANRLSHAYVMEGEEGMGKKTLVEAIANYLLCPEKQGDDICGKCRACVQFQSGNHPDVIEVTPSKKTGYGVDDIREMVLDDVNIRPYQSEYKIYLIAQAETMSVAAQNVLLKTIENPPAYALFFLMTTNKERLLETILSRCVLLRMGRLSPKEMEEFLERRGQAEKRDLIPYAEGNIGKLLQLTESESFQEMKKDLENLLEQFVKRQDYDIMNQVGLLEKYEDNLQQALNILQILLRERLRKSQFCGMEFQNQPVFTEGNEQRYFKLSQNILTAKKQLVSNVNKNLIIWNLFLF